MKTTPSFNLSPFLSAEAHYCQYPANAPIPFSIHSNIHGQHFRRTWNTTRDEDAVILSPTLEWSRKDHLAMGAKKSLTCRNGTKRRSSCRMTVNENRVNSKRKREKLAEKRRKLKDCVTDVEQSVFALITRKHEILKIVMKLTKSIRVSVYLSHREWSAVVLNRGMLKIKLKNWWQQ